MRARQSVLPRKMVQGFLTNAVKAADSWATWQGFQDCPHEALCLCLQVCQVFWLHRANAWLQDSESECGNKKPNGAARELVRTGAPCRQRAPMTAGLWSNRSSYVSWGQHAFYFIGKHDGWEQWLEMRVMWKLDIMILSGSDIDLRLCSVTGAAWDMSVYGIQRRHYST